MKKKAALFIDRDGTLIEETNYLVSAEQIQVFPHSFEAVRQINDQGVPAILVTNQSAVARGLLSEQQLTDIHRSLESLFNQNGARLDAIYYCPHHPYEGSGPYTVECDCRKPKPGLLLQAAFELELDLSRCVVIGDTLSDVEAGHRVGSLSVLVKTGYGAEIAALLEEKSESRQAASYPDYIASDILQAVNWSLERIGEKSSS